MCMLTYFPPGVQPDREALINGTIPNRDGHGYTIIIPGESPRLLVRHSLNGAELVDRFLEDRFTFPEGAALFHSRFGTSGQQGLYNCHPFNLSGDERTVVAHNGVLPMSMLPDKGDARCDTRKAADETFATSYGHLSKGKARRKLGKAIGKNNKLVILSVDPSLPATMIINEDSGIWEDGIWYSNLDYCGYRPVYTPTFRSWDDYYSKEDDCPFCQATNSINVELQICNMCHACLDCDEPDFDNCLCSLADLDKQENNQDDPQYPYAAQYWEFAWRDSRQF